MEAHIQITNLSKVYPMGRERVVALDNVSLTVYRGEICCVLGTSGSGKSTLLNMIAGLERPSSGKIEINRRSIEKMSETELVKFRQDYIGFIFQSYNLIPGLTAVENVAMPLMFRGMEKSKRLEAAKKILNDVSLGDRSSHLPTQMSGGQQQRVGIARAFVSNPEIVFADEPTGNLDSKTTKDVMELMVNLSRTHNQTVILVTHDPLIASYADRIVHIIDGKIDSDLINESIVPKT